MQIQMLEQPYWLDKYSDKITSNLCKRIAR